MNELVKKCAQEAGSTHKQNLGVYQFYTDELEKFAQLIIEECELAFWSEACRVSDLAYLEYSSNCKKIQEHFRA